MGYNFYFPLKNEFMCRAKIKLWLEWLENSIVYENSHELQLYCHGLQQCNLCSITVTAREH